MSTIELLREILKHPMFLEKYNINDDFVNNIEINQRYGKPVIDIILIYLIRKIENNEPNVSIYRIIKNYFEIN